MKKLYESWKKRKLTIFGKTEIVNTLGINKFIYVASILPLPNEDVIKKLYGHIFNFIWNNKDRIKRKTIIGKIEEGGTGIVDVLLKFQALKAAWIPRFLRNKGRSILGEHLDHLLKSNNIDFEYMLKLNCVKLANFEMFKNLPLFYKEIFMYFNQCKKLQKYQV